MIYGSMNMDVERPGRPPWRALALVGIAACGSSASGATATGELGNGVFEYACASASDPVCEAGQPATDFPDCLMEGGRFEISYTVHDLDELHGWGYDFVYVKPASPSFFGGLDTMTALRTGRAAFIAYADDNVIDILHLDIVTPTAMNLRYADLTALGSVVEVEVGANVTLVAQASSTGCAQAGGGVPVSTESSDSAIAAVTGDDSVLISGMAEGTAMLTVHMGALSQQVEVHVVPNASTTIGDTDSAGSSDDSASGGTDADGTGTTSADSTSTTGADTDATTGGSDGGSSTDTGSTGVAT